MIMRYIKKDLETFDYNKSYDIKCEHKWDFAKDDEKVKKYFEKIEEITNVDKFKRIQKKLDRNINKKERINSLLFILTQFN